MSEQLTIYYDDSCGFCRKQIDKIRSEDTYSRLRFVGGNRGPYLYAQEGQGQKLDGVDAFAQIWKVTGHPMLSFLCRWPVSKPMARLIYWLIARYRHFLNPDSC